ncbi:hypothetical protein BHE74_00041730, partial [Ensete ventricosum]
MDIARTGSSANRNADCPLSGGTADWGCFRSVTTRNRSVTIDFNCRWPLSSGNGRFDHCQSSGGNGRFRPSAADFMRYEGERRKGRTWNPTLLSRSLRPRAISSPYTGRRNVSPRVEKEQGA